METQAKGDIPIDGVRVPAGWDHEHCSICWEKIGAGGQTVGYVDQSNEWVCQACHKNFIEPGSIGFVTWIGGITARPVPNPGLDQRKE
jgi:hypothetical protein